MALLAMTENEGPPAEGGFALGLLGAASVLSLVPAIVVLPQVGLSHGICVASLVAFYWLWAHTISMSPAVPPGTGLRAIIGQPRLHPQLSWPVTFVILQLAIATMFAALYLAHLAGAEFASGRQVMVFAAVFVPVMALALRRALYGSRS